MEKEQHKILSYRTYFLVFLGLVALLFISIASTHIDVGINLVVVAIIISLIQAALVLSIYMHLSFTSRMYTVMVVIVVLVYLALIIITFLDYLFR
jgi:cytochrome c oxidase subunit IV